MDWLIDRAAALVCELAGDYISCLQCRLCDCCNGVEGDPSEACARALIDTLRDVNASALGDKKEDLISAAVNEVYRFAVGMSGCLFGFPHENHV